MKRNQFLFGLTLLCSCFYPVSPHHYNSPQVKEMNIDYTTLAEKFQYSEASKVDEDPSEFLSMGGDLGIDLGEDMGVGLSPGIRCVEGTPRGEDGKMYCKKVTKEDKERVTSKLSELILLTANGTESDAQIRLLRSAKIYNYDVKVLSEDEVVDAVTQLKLLRQEVEKIQKENTKKIILFVDGPDVILTAGPVRIIEELEFADAGILLSARGKLKADEDQQKEYPQVNKGRKFFDAGAFVGTAEAIHGLLKEFPDEKDLQVLMEKAYLKDSLRKKYQLKIDHTSGLFQNLNGATGDLELRFAGKEAYIQNVQYNTVPAIVRADRHTQTTLNSYGSYIARSWNSDDGCRECWENMNHLDKVEEKDFPMVTLVITVEKPTPFIDEFFAAINKLTYPRNKLHLYLHNQVEYHKKSVEQWFADVKDEFYSTKVIDVDEKAVKEWHAKNGAIDYCLERECDYVFFVDSEAMIDNPFTLKLLIEQNRKVVAPMLPRPGKAWSNFWGALTADGFYARSDDYMEIVQNEKRGLWNVPYVGSSFLVQRSLLEHPKKKPNFINNLLDPDMAFCQNLRDQGVFLYVSNRVDMGHMVSTESFDVNHLHPELWELFENRYDWERRYLHENYSQSLNTSNKILSPCPDVFWFPIFTERFAKEMIEVMENYGSWSDGSHEDKYRGGPVQAALSSVGYGGVWQQIISKYVTPFQKRTFIGYNHFPPRALMSFVVRYKPDEQPFLKPHHDTSTYTINVALNRPNIDFEGGGCRFIRYDCSVLDTRVGWVLMHPGKLTHLHEGLVVTKGTRYIIVTFVDP